ncbi:MAG TPA: hypothetical protein VFV38_01725 [Ktedonobacteraceae bacterium]|nr:hypothetical protein [Ktedonobacteraceae bacterium]
MPENRQSPSMPTHEPQRWLAKQLTYTELFHTAISDDGREQRAAAAIATQLFSSYLLLSLIEHARSVYTSVLEHFPVPETVSQPDELTVVSALTTCLIRWQNEVEDMAHPTEEEAAAVSTELVILALSLFHPAWVREVPDLLQAASAADEEDEKLLAAIGYSRERLILALTENALDVTSARLYGVIRRLATAIRQAADDELTETLQNLSFPLRLTKRRAQALRDQIAEEIQQDDGLRRYFSVCRRIEVEPAGRIGYHIHFSFEAYSRHYGEMWIRDEKHWRKEADKIRQEGKEGAI